MDTTLMKRQVGERLRQFREAIGLTQQQVADLYHTGDKTKISHYEKGKNFPDHVLLFNLWRHRRLSVDWLFFNDHSALQRDLAGSFPLAAGASEAVSPEASPPAPKKRARKPVSVE